MTGADRFSLTDLEQASEVALDPQIWARNLASLQLQSPQLVAALERAALPAHWRSVRALDGSVSFRVEESGAVPLWLGGTAAPNARAAGLLQSLRVGEQNPVLPALASGAELRFLLDHLPSHRAVYVFEEDLHVMSAVLRAADYEQDIQNGRFILTPPGGEAEFLNHQLSTYPGLLPPGLIICLPHVPQSRLAQVRVICERAAQNSHAARGRRLGELAKPPAAAAAPHEQIRLALLALRPDPVAQHVAGALENAARQLGWPVLSDVVRTPRDVHALAHAERLAGFRPGAVLCIGHSGDLSFPVGGTVCEWRLNAADVPTQTAGKEALRLGASPRISDRLRLTAADRAAVGDWYWGCEPAGVGENTKDAVILVADLPDDDPGLAGVEQPSHKLLWKHAQQCIRQLWSDGKFIEPAVVLRQAEHSAGLEMPAGEVRAALLQAIERALIPATLVRTIFQTLASGAFEQGAIGQGWPRQAESEKEAIASCSIWEFIKQAKPWRPVAAVFAGVADPLSPALMQAGALGWPLLLYGPGGAVSAAALGAILRPEDYRTFLDRRSLVAALQEFRRNPTITWERARETGRHLCAEHSYAQRLRQLGKLLQEPARSGKR